MHTSADFQAIIHQHIARKQSLHIGESALNTSNYAGIVEYYPEELVITVKAGTPAAFIHKTLVEHGQALTFQTNPAQSIGAIYATGDANLADSVLGVKIIDGRGDALTFGGQVMKNVAGYDVARLLVGSCGQLALITQISFKVLPSAYIHYAPQPEPSPSASPLRARLERSLKSVFNPFDVFR